MQEQLRDKIEQLFEYRAFPELYRLSGGSSGELKRIHKQLVELQARIYDLDGYLEANWELKDKQLSHYWNKIYASLTNMGIPSSKQYEYCSQIHKYQKHEVDLRHNLMPTRLDMEYFYFYKSCDVKLQRRLLIENFPTLKKLFTAGDWRYFDLVTEINDDATDLEEDTSTINGNRLLISFYLKGKSSTKEEFGDFLDKVIKKSKERFGYGHPTSFRKNIHFRTVEQAKATRLIIDHPPIKIAEGTIKLPIQHFLKLNERA